MVVIPSTIQVFAWCWTMVMGTPRFRTPLLFIAGFIFMFVTGGLTGIMFVAIPFDQQVTDTYFVIAHFHYIIFGAAVFPIFGGMYYWFPKVTGKLYFERPGQISFWILFVGTNLLFFPMHIVGLLGMPRRELHVSVRARLGRPTTCSRRSAATSRSSGSCCCSATSSSATAAAPRPAPTRGTGRRSSGRRARRRPSTTSRSSRRCGARTRTGTSEDRAADRAQLAAGVLLLDEGHQQPVVTPVDGHLAEIAEMPHDSWAPILLALTLSLVFAMLVIQQYGAAAIFGLVTPARARGLALARAARRRCRA